MSIRSPKKPEYFPNPEVPMGLWCMRDQQPTPMHGHDFIEIAIITEGTGEHNFRGTVLPVSTGDVFVVNAGESHSWETVDNMDVINIMIHDLESIPELSQFRAHPAFSTIFLHEPNMRLQQKGKGRLRLNMDEITEVTQLAKRLDHALHRQEPPFPLISRVIFLNLVSLFCESYLAAPQEEQCAALRIAEAIRNLEANVAVPPAHEVLASITHTSVPTFYRLFRLATGTTPANYINGLRARKAAELLSKTDRSITEIAYNVGFSDSNYFSTVFRKIQGMSPRKYRHIKAGQHGLGKRHPKTSPSPTDPAPVLDKN